MDDEQFRSDFATLTGHGPLAWQQRLYDRFAGGDMPGQIDIPTGLGKTMVMVLKLG